MLIVIEGTDGSGKATQTKMLSDKLSSLKKTHLTIDFPRYDKASSALIKAYLHGEFGSNPSDVNPYAASTFYAVDRVASYLSDWKDFYQGDGVILADRYTTSNATHQGSKFSNEADRENFFEWLYNFEYEKLGLPVPDAVILLDVPVKVTQSLMGVRDKLDIHESNEIHLNVARESALHAAKYFDWSVISCVDSRGFLRTQQDIHAEIWACIRNKVMS